MQNNEPRFLYLDISLFLNSPSQTFNFYLYCSLAGYVESLATKLGMQVPDMTPKQADMWQTRLSSHMVRLDISFVHFF